MTTPLPMTKVLEAPARAAAEERLDAGRPRLLIVISGVADEVTLARRILGLCPDPSLPVLIVGLAGAWDGEYELRRRLVTVESFLAAHGHPVELLTDFGHGWPDRLASKARAADQVVCYEELGVASSAQPLSDLVARALRLPVRDLTDLVTIHRGPARILPQVAAWLGSIAIIAGFTLFQARIVTELLGWAQNAMLLVTVGAEIGVVLLWNTILG